MCEKKNIDRLYDLITAFVVFTAVLLTHIYFFTHKFTNTDDLFNPIKRHEDTLSLGRWAQDIIYWIRGEYTLPMIIGVISVGCLTLSGILVARIFNIKSRALVVIVGIIIGAFPTLSYTFSYIFNADMYSFAILLAVAAVFFMIRRGDSVKTNIISLICGSISLAVSCGIYQSFVALSVGICLLRIVVRCLDTSSEDKEIVSEIKRMLVSGVCGIVLYTVVLYTVLAWKGRHISSYRGMNTLFSTISLRKLGKALGKCYLSSVDFYCNDLIIHFPNGVKMLQTLLILLGIVMFCVILKKNGNKKRAFIAIGFTILLPIVININNVLMEDYSYALVNYTYVLPILLAICMVDVWIENSLAMRAPIIRGIIIGFAFLGWHYGVIDNVYYLKADIVYQRTTNLCNRILTRIEEMENFSNEKKVLLIGTLPNRNYTISAAPFKADVPHDTGLGNGLPIFYSRLEPLINTMKFSSFCEDILGVEMQSANKEDLNRVMDSEQIYDMPIWPAEGCIKEIEDVIVVNLDYSAKICYTKDGNHIETSVKMAEAAGATQYATYLFYNGNQIDTKCIRLKTVIHLRRLKPGNIRSYIL